MPPRVILLLDMPYASPKYSKEEVDRAGDIFINPQTPVTDSDHSLEVINNWRSSHNLPLLFFRLALAQKARRVDPKYLIAQRIKRLPAIRLKLERLPRLKLSQIQDIGGCRAVVQNIQRVKELVVLYARSRAKHTYDHTSDYLESPKSDGYRGVHLIYRYCSEQYQTHNGLKIEIQLRSKLQHAWATAVETVGIFTGEALKSSQGSEDWRRFFALMGTAIAMREKGKLIPNTPIERKPLVAELRTYVSKLDAQRRLDTYSSMLQIPKQPGLGRSQYFLLELDPVAKHVRVTGYKKTELALASDQYLKVERSIATKSNAPVGAQAVLVSVESLSSLRRAYPNYFLDMRVFIEEVSRALTV